MFYLPVIRLVLILKSKKIVAEDAEVSTGIVAEDAENITHL